MTTAEGLGKRYRKTWALRDCGFDLQPGRVTALVGANGAGKTTLLLLLAGLLPPDEGKVDIDARTSFVAHDMPLYKRFNAQDTLRLAKRLNKTWDQQRAERWLERFQVPLDRPCGKLSAGQKAQVAFAAALAAKPDILLLDEPLANLDPLARREVMAELLSEVADAGMSLVLSTHVVAELGGVADHLLLLSKGRLVLDGDLDELMAAHTNYVGPRAQAPPSGEVVHASHHELQSTFLVRLEETHEPEAPWTTRPVTVEDLVIAHLARSGGAA